MVVSAYCITHLRCCMRTRASYFEREPLPRMIGNVEQKAQKHQHATLNPSSGTNMPLAEHPMCCQSRKTCEPHVHKQRGEPSDREEGSVNMRDREQQHLWPVLPRKDRLFVDQSQNK